MAKGLQPTYNNRVTGDELIIRCLLMLQTTCRIGFLFCVYYMPRPFVTCHIELKKKVTRVILFIIRVISNYYVPLAMGKHLIHAAVCMPD